jgi:lysozyme
MAPVVDPALTLAVALINGAEGCALTSYPDPATHGAPWTIGWGSTRFDGYPVHAGQVITQAQADAARQGEILPALASVRKLVTVPLLPHPTAALTSFEYNLGAGALARSTLLRLLNAGNRPAALAEFRKWVYANGRPMLGLLRRRWAEAAVFLGVDPVKAWDTAQAEITALGQWPTLPALPDVELAPPA